MRELIYLILYLVTEFTNYLLAYGIIFQAEITKSKKRWLLAAAVILSIHLTVFFVYSSYDAQAISFMTMIVIPVFLLDTWEKKWFLLYPFVMMGTSVISISVSFIASVVLNVSEDLLVMNGNYMLFFQAVPFFIMLPIYVYRKLRGYQSVSIKVRSSQYILFYVGAFCTFFMLTPIQAMSGGNLSDKLINVCGVSVSVASVVFIILILWQGIVVQEKIEYREKVKRYEEYMKIQSEYFQGIMEQDEKMRHFRHDMDNHLEILRAYCSERNYEEMEDYLSHMIEGSAIYDIKNYTGNKGLDAVIRTFVGKAEDKKIAIEINGKLPKEMKISLYDCCTIVSNLMSNAIEACEKIEVAADRKIKMEISAYQSQVYLCVRNTVAKDVPIHNHRLLSSKADKKNHGLGSENVQNTVKKYQGNLTYRCENGWFIAEIDI